jgi:hypothetical protein
MNEHISYSATNSQTEPSRIERLKDVVISYQTKIPKLNFHRLHDHKGELTVSWSQQPSEEEKNIIGDAWEEQNELRENVIHEIDQ